MAVMCPHDVCARAGAAPTDCREAAGTVQRWLTAVVVTGGISPAICPVADLVRKADMQPALPCLALALA